MRYLTTADVLVGFVGGSVDVVGIFGNISMLIVLLSKPAEKPMYIILRTMSIINVLVLALNAVFQALPIICRVTGAIPSKSLYRFAYEHGHYTWLTAIATHCVKVWLTLLLSIERWIAVCHPLAFSVHSSFLTRRVRWVIGLIFLTSVLFTIPRGFERECVSIKQKASAPSQRQSQSQLQQSQSQAQAQLQTHTSNDSLVSRLGAKCEWRPTELVKSEVYSYAYGVAAYAVLVFLIPVGTTLVLNGHIIYELRRGDAMIATLSVTQRYERKISKVPLAVAIIFCVLQTPAMLINVVEFGGLAEKLELQKEVWRPLVAVTMIMILMDSSADFIVYFYNMNCSGKNIKMNINKSILRLREKFKKGGENKTKVTIDQPTDAIMRSSCNVILNELTTSKLILVQSESQTEKHLTVKHSVVYNSKNFSFS